MISVLIGVQPLGDCQLSIKQLLMNQSRYKQTNKQFIYLFVLLWMWRSYSVSVCNKHWAVNYISQNTLCWTHFYFLCHSENSEFDPLHLKHMCKVEKSRSSKSIYFHWSQPEFLRERFCGPGSFHIQEVQLRNGTRLQKAFSCSKFKLT